MNIDALQPGPELDKLVSDMVMDSPKHDWADNIGQPGILSTYEGCRYCETQRKAERENETCIKPYSTDITAAWQVLKELVSKRLGQEHHPDFMTNSRERCRSGLYKPVVRIEAYEHDDEYEVRIGRCNGLDGGDDIVVKEVGGDFDTTIPLLICRAALLAMKVYKKV